MYITKNGTKTTSNKKQLVYLMNFYSESALILFMFSCILDQSSTFQLVLNVPNMCTIITYIYRLLPWYSGLKGLVNGNISKDNMHR